MSVRDSSPTSLAARRTSVKSRHFGIGAGFVDEDEALRVKIELAVEPVFAPLQDVRAVRSLAWADFF